MRTILALGAHFDDIEIGIAGILMKHVIANDKIYFCVLYADEAKTGSPKIRFLEQSESLRLMKISQSNLIIFSSKSEDCHIISCLDDIYPNIIYIPYWEDTHQDHRRCSFIGQSVGRKTYITTMFYAGASAINFNPSIFVSIDFKKKLKVLNCYKSQKLCGAINIDRIKKRELYWGSLISDNRESYAEGLISNKIKIKIG